MPQQGSAAQAKLSEPIPANTLSFGGGAFGSSGGGGFGAGQAAAVWAVFVLETSTTLRGRPRPTRTTQTHCHNNSTPCRHAKILITSSQVSPLRGEHGINTIINCHAFAPGATGTTRIPYQATQDAAFASGKNGNGKAGLLHTITAMLPYQGKSLEVSLCPTRTCPTKNASKGN